MSPAAEAMAEALAEVELRAPCVPVVANVVAGPIADPAEIRRRLIEQVTGRVRWRECMSFMAGQGVDLFCEFGAGKVLSGLVKRTAPTANAMAAGTPDEIAAVAAQLRQG
jgi:[acyl-carrier-protein] S-malonyltransferase